MTPSHDDYDVVVRDRLAVLWADDKANLALLFRAVAVRADFGLDHVPDVVPTLELTRGLLAATVASTDDAVRYWAARSALNVEKALAPPEPEPEMLSQLIGLPIDAPNDWRRAAPRLALEAATFAVLLDLFRLPGLGSSRLVLDGAVAILRAEIAGADPRARRAGLRAETAAMKPYRRPKMSGSWLERVEARARAAWQVHQRRHQDPPPTQRLRPRGLRSRGCVVAQSPLPGGSSPAPVDFAADSPATAPIACRPRRRTRGPRPAWRAAVLAGPDPQRNALGEQRLGEVLRRLLR